jgi:hypothetical protein
MPKAIIHFVSKCLQNVSIFWPVRITGTAAGRWQRAFHLIVSDELFPDASVRRMDELQKKYYI